MNNLQEFKKRIKEIDIKKTNQQQYETLVEEWYKIIFGKGIPK
jgi:hypothetical protein